MGLEGWRWLFIIEGAGTVFFGIVSKFVLLDYPENTARLSAEERELATVRLIHDRKTTTTMAAMRLSPLQALRAALFDFRTYIFTVLYMLANGSTTVSYFIPTVLGSMGYEGTQKQWMTIPIWAVGIFFLIAIPQVADRTGDRRWCVSGGLFMSFVSALICWKVEIQNVRYAFLCFYIAGLYSTLPLILTWASETIPLPAEKRAVAIAIANSVGNLSAVYGSRLWPSSDAPGYSTGFTAVTCFTLIGSVLAAIAPILFERLPHHITKAEHDVLDSDGASQVRGV